MRRIFLLLFLALPLAAQTTIGVVNGGTSGGSGTVTSVGASVPAYMSVTGSPITDSGTLAFSFGSQLTNLGFFSPCGSSGVPTFRALCISDFPASVATASNTVSTLVLRDGSGNFAAGTITAALSGNATTATTAANLSGSNLSGDVTNTANAITIAADSVALGADTTGGYAASTTEGGPATTATALAANGANCSAGNYPLGVDASGAAENCTAAPAAFAAAGSGSEIQARSSATAVQAVTGSSTASGGIALVNQSSSAIPFSVTGAASQSVNLMNVTSSGGTAGDRFKVDKDGNGTFGGTVTAGGATFSNNTGVTGGNLNLSSGVALVSQFSEIKGKEKTLTDNVATAILNVTLGTSDTAIGGFVNYTVMVWDTATHATQVTTGQLPFTISNVNGTVSVGTLTAVNTLATLSTGTDAISFTSTVAGTTATIKVTSDTSLTATTHKIDSLFLVQSAGVATVTPQ